MNRHLARAALLALVLASPPAEAGSEDGGSGLIRIDQAYSLPFGRPLVSVYGGYFSDDVGPGDARYLTLVPSLTWGLGNGFEVSGSMQFDGITEKLDTDFDRRVDIRRRDAFAKVRWTGPLGTTRFRVGVQGMAGLPFGGDDRAGATQSADELDPGVMGLVSTNVGWFDFPVRIHGNVGYWWSRDDGAFYYRQFPSPISFPSPNTESNDVLSIGIGAEVGLNRALVIAELTTEQFVESRSQMRGSENLWQLTLGARTLVSSTIGLTGGVTFDLSRDDDSTVFDPGEAYPDVEFRVGMTFGSVLSRQNYERGKRQPRKSSGEIDATALTPEAVAKTEPKSVERVVERIAEVPEDARLRELEARIRQLEIDTRLGLLETRMRLLERGGVVPAPVAVPVLPAPVPTPTPTKSAPAPTDTTKAPVQTSQLVPSAEVVTPRELELRAELATLQREVQAMRPEAAPVPVVASTPSNEEVATAEAETVADSPSAPAVAEVGSTPAPSAREIELEGQLEQMRAQLEATEKVAREAAERAARPPATQGVPSASPTRLTVIDGTATGSPAAGTVVTPVVGVPVQSAPAPAPALPETTVPAPAPARPASPVPTPDPAAPMVEAEIEGPAAKTVVDPFPFPVGEREMLKGFVLADVNPANASANREVLDPLAQLLALNPEVKVTVLVHAGGADRLVALERSETQARAIRDYLVIAGAGPDQVAALGMGQAEAGAAPEGQLSRVEIERTR